MPGNFRTWVHRLSPAILLLTSLAAPARADLLVCKAPDRGLRIAMSFEPREEMARTDPAGSVDVQGACLPLAALAAVIPWNVGQQSSTSGSSSSVTQFTNNGSGTGQGGEGTGGGGTTGTGHVAEVPEPCSLLLGALGTCFVGLGSLTRKLRGRSRRH